MRHVRRGALAALAALGLGGCALLAGLPDVSLESTGAEAQISVRDRGIGIPLADQPLVFDRFHRAKNVDDRRFAGMGLGLYIARGIVEQHAGRIWLESTADVGSTFYVALPVIDSTLGMIEPQSDARLASA